MRQHYHSRSPRAKRHHKKRFSFLEILRRYVGMPVLLSLVVLFSLKVTSDAVAKSLLLDLKFDEGSGTIAVDASGNGNNGTLMGNAVWAWDSGFSGSAVQFDGIDDYIETVSSTSLGPTDITVTAWFKLTSGITSTYQTLIGYNWWGKWGRLRITGNNALDWWFYDSNTVQHRLLTVPPLSPDTWYQAAITFDKASQTAKLYLDGIKVASKTGVTDIERGDWVHKVFIGAVAENVFKEYFNGVIDEVRIYDYAMSADEIRQERAKQFPCILDSDNDGYGTGASLTGCISTSLTDCNDNDAAVNPGAFEICDSVDNNCDGQTDGTNALSFDGVDDYVDVGNDMGLAPTSITIEAWFKLDNMPAAVGNDMTIIGYHWWGRWGRLGVNRWNNLQWLWFGSQYSGGDTSSPYFYWLQYPISSTNTWYHAALTFDKATQTAKMYLNGVEVVSKTGVADIERGDWVYKVFIGAAKENVFKEYFDGVIDEVRIYDRALTATEIQDHYNNGVGEYGGPFELNLVAGWHFDEYDGFTTADYSKKGNDGWVHGGTWTAGKIDVCGRVSGGICGNGLYELGETCSNCPEDVGCGPGICSNDMCVVPKCLSDTNCYLSGYNSIGAYNTRCENAGTATAYCSYTDAAGNPVTPTCSDGTPLGRCSATQPKYGCDNSFGGCKPGALVDDCYTCGCPSGQKCDGGATCIY